MTKAAKEARRAYKREWARNHPDNVKASQEKYWEKKAAEAAAIEAAEAEAIEAEAAEAEQDEDGSRKESE